jgi:hypothetical protein
MILKYLHKSYKEIKIIKEVIECIMHCIQLCVYMYFLFLTGLSLFFGPLWNLIQILHDPNFS